MATDKWLDDTANWDTPSDWSAGLPGPTSDVVINEGNPEITASFGTVNSISIGSTAQLTYYSGASSVTGAVTVTGAEVDLGGSSASSLTIGGTLTNEGGIFNIGSNSSASTVQAARVANRVDGAIDVVGPSGAESTLDVASAAGFGAAGVLSGTVDVTGDARIEFRSGKITTIAANSDLSLFGRDAVVADANAANQSWSSALAGLDVVDGAGALDLEDGAVVTTGALTNSGTIALDEYSGYGGSFLNVLGTLTNDGRIAIGPGNDTLSARSMLTAASIVNDGTIELFGDGSKSVHATLDTTGSFVNNRAVNVNDDYDKLVGAIGGTGTFNLSDASTIEFAGPVSRGQTIDFANGQIDRLSLDAPSSFDATIDDFFTKGDIVIAKGFAEAQTLLSYTQTGADSCSWTLTEGANTAVLNFAGEPYAKSDFSITPTTSGAGTVIKFV